MLYGNSGSRRNRNLKLLLFKKLRTVKPGWFYIEGDRLSLRGMKEEDNSLTLELVSPTTLIAAVNINLENVRKLNTWLNIMFKE